MVLSTPDVFLVLLKAGPYRLPRGVGVGDARTISAAQRANVLTHGCVAQSFYNCGHMSRTEPSPRLCRIGENCPSCVCALQDFSFCEGSVLDFSVASLIRHFKKKKDAAQDTLALDPVMPCVSSCTQGSEERYVSRWSSSLFSAPFCDWGTRLLTSPPCWRRNQQRFHFLMGGEGKRRFSIAYVALWQRWKTRKHS